MEKDVAISVKNISKTFEIPHEKVSSLRGAAVGILKKNHLRNSRHWMMFPLRLERVNFLE